VTKDDSRRWIAYPKKSDGAPRVACRSFFEQHKCRGFAYRDAVAVGRERPALPARGKLQGVKTVEGCQAQRIDPAYHGGIDDAELDHALCGPECFGARRTGRRDYSRRTSNTKQFAREGGGGKNIVAAGIIKTCRQLAALRVAMPIGQLGLQNPRGAGAKEQPDAVRANAADAVCDRRHETVLAQSQKCQSVVATLKPLPAGG